MDNTEELKLIRLLSDENKKLKKVGGKLALRALYTVTEYDGLHRLSLAIAEWNKTIANEFGRNKKK